MANVMPGKYSEAPHFKMSSRISIVVGFQEGRFAFVSALFGFGSFIFICGGRRGGVNVKEGINLHQFTTGGRSPLFHDIGAS